MLRGQESPNTQECVRVLQALTASRNGCTSTAKGSGVNHLTRADYARALSVLAQLGAQDDDATTFASRAVQLLADFVACEFATLSVCDLVTGHRQVMGLPGIRFGAQDLAAFDRHFFEHPLVRYHGLQSGRATHRIADAMSLNEFRGTGLYADYYRRIGIEHVMAVPILRRRNTLVSFVFNRAGFAFSERDRERLDLLRPHLAYLYRNSCARSRAPLASQASTTGPPMLPPVPVPLPPTLTPREGEVLTWLACGKTDGEIAGLLGLSPRTVHKHLEHMYIKLGVETRTAAVMRALSSVPQNPG